MRKIFLILIMAGPLFTTAQLKYPETKKIPVVDDYHGTKVEDPYRWLEDDNAETTRSWVKEENKVTFDYLATIPIRDRVKKDWKNYGIIPNIHRLSKKAAISISLKMMVCKTRRSFTVNWV